MPLQLSPTALVRACTVALNALLISLIALTSQLAGAEKVLSATDQTHLEALKETAKSSELSWTLLESLTTEVGARLAGTESDARAVAWAVEKMNSLGFDKVWTEAAPLTPWVRGEASVHITAPFPHRLAAISLGGSVGTPRRGITAEIVRFDDLDALKAAPDGSLKGKIAYVANRMERHRDGSGYGPAVAARSQGASVAASKGASAYLLRSIGTDNNRTPHTGSMTYADKSSRIPALAVSNPDADLLDNMIRRGAVTVKMKSTARRYDNRTVMTHNVIGEITGSQAPEELVAVGAHLDSWDVGTGAMDDGLGVSIAISSAALIKQAGLQPKRTIRVILYAAEEVGFIGTRQYMEDHHDEVGQHAIGAEWDFGIGEIYSFKSGVGEQALPAIRELASYLKDLGVAHDPANDGRAQSDMVLLSEAGMPAINFAPDGSRYFDLHHTDNDTLDKIDPEALKQNTAVYTVFAWFAAQSGVDFRK